MAVFGRMWLYLAKVFLFEQSGSIRAKFVVFEKN